ncbi:MAG: metal-dependent hydrolase [Acetobacteraceae bacterium]|nr:metal-dependent hydrolase [Acetobacteraceae bacterium]
MMAGSHVALGAAAWMLAAPHLGQDALAPAGLGLAVAGSLLPDVDHPKSWAGRRLRPVSHLVAAVFGHRGVTHSLLALVGCWAALRHGTGVPRAWVAPVVVGYLSHLLGDLLTPGGLRLAWPLRGTWALPLCRSGSPFEPLVVALVLSAAAWSALPERPDPRAALQRVGLRLDPGASKRPLPLPPPAPLPARQKWAAQHRGPGRGG